MREFITNNDFKKGFYFVKHHGVKTVAEFTGEHWLLLGSAAKHCLADFDHIWKDRLDVLYETTLEFITSNGIQMSLDGQPTKIYHLLKGDILKISTKADPTRTEIIQDNEQERLLEYVDKLLKLLDRKDKELTKIKKGYIQIPIPFYSYFNYR